ncbi:hypothetical protein FGE12_20465 [Aggregicoccus sp. 17bor-14]|uniref:hypothetical protein n=1 Tax=Myxococcaceae TaxID=31 RepID=UPI00129CB3C8|nr:MULTISPECIES: hypothetical protein [Myxococcaceae]MBF5044784.1 hypothetical protein [Simulacricoccus sp. 17bor-14]MRI90528.1 hypothetical protein [Aggregicoccus sp. 17bor-14]
MLGPGELMQAGGVGMWGVLTLGLVTLGNAALFAWRPERRRVGVIACMALATVGSLLLASITGFAHVGIYASDMAREGQSVVAVVIGGLAESLAPAVLGFALLTVTAVVTAVGMRRLGALEAEPHPAPVTAPAR